MEGSRLIDVFQVLTKKERFEIGKALHSPLFNQREDVVQLWNLLCKKKETPTKEEVFSPTLSTKRLRRTTSPCRYELADGSH